MEWFQVDKDGLGKLLDRRGRQFVMFELMSNAWDQNVTKVAVSLIKNVGERHATLTVEDDDPDGFADLSHAFTLFADSAKTHDAEKRGRFNLGEKLVLSLCDEASIISTTGGIQFDAEGRHVLRRKRERGSLFTGRIRMTNAEYEECVSAISRVIPPPGIVTTITTGRPPDIAAEVMQFREPLTTFEDSLPTEIADEEGVLRRRVRRTTIRVYSTQDGEPGMLYEMGIPVVETGDTYHVNVGQKVPLNVDRDNVPPRYLRDVRTLVLNHMHDRITDSETANMAWVRDSLGDANVEETAVRSIVALRFGKKAVAFDPSDPEANNRAVSEGYTVVHGSQLSKAEWENVRRAEVLPAAGRVTPSAKAYSDDPDALPVKVIDQSNWTEAERKVVLAIERIGRELLGFVPSIRIVATTNNFAVYGGRRLDLNRVRLGRAWFADCLIAGRLTVVAIDLIIHEFGHEFSSNHLSSKYYEALSRLGAKLTHLVADRPTLLGVA